jgi:hypothetical protein
VTDATFAGAVGALKLAMGMRRTVDRAEGRTQGARSRRPRPRRERVAVANRGREAGGRAGTARRATPASRPDTRYGAPTPASRPRFASGRRPSLLARA